MNDYDNFTPAFEDDESFLPHLPLDWNEDLSLEEYLERILPQGEKINPTITS